MTSRGNRKVRAGRVITRGGDKTVGVLVERRVRHPLYGKEMSVSSKIMAHDEENQAAVGDKVRVMETRPVSRTKRWRVIEVLGKGAELKEE